MEFLIATGVVFLGSTFMYYFLYKLHMRGINVPDFSSHRHPENLRRKRKEVVEFDTMEILRMKPLSLEEKQASLQSTIDELNSYSWKA